MWPKRRRAAGQGMVFGLCPEQGHFMRVCPKRGKVGRLWSLHMAHAIFSNPRSETFAGF